VTVDLLVGGELQDSRRAELEISPLHSLPAPILVSRALLTEADELLATGIQHLNTGNIQAAKERLARAHSLKPGPATALALSEVLFRIGEFQPVIELLEPYDRSEAPAELVSLLGRAFHSLNQPERAAIYYEQYLNRFGVNLEILNFLGSCYYQIGDKDRALALWEKSLGLNPNQDKTKGTGKFFKKEINIGK